MVRPDRSIPSTESRGRPTTDQQPSEHLYVPLTAVTRDLVGAEALAAMRPDAVLINTSHGGIVDEPTVAEALRGGRLAGAALDVFAHEPLAREAARAFAGCPNLILTPHVTGATAESDARVSLITAGNARRVLTRWP
jgi:(S)-sulfolactate dehydrogenase